MIEAFFWYFSNSMALQDAPLIERLTRLILRASAAVLALDPSTVRRRSKGDLSPVTAADEIANSLITEGLSEFLPSLPVVSEEADRRASGRDLGRTFILLDPLDGTREFLAGRDEYTINVALIADGIPTLGVIAAPALGLVWRGVQGESSERAHVDFREKSPRIMQFTKIRTRNIPAGDWIAAVSRSHFDPETAAFLDGLPIGKQVACGSSLKFCQIAEGSVDIYPRLAPTSEWDIAAGHALLVAAGGEVTMPDGSQIAYGNSARDFKIPAFIAWGDRTMIALTRDRRSQLSEKSAAAR